MVEFVDGKPYVFVSYSSRDRVEVVNTLRILKEKYNVNIWYDSNLLAGNSWAEEAWVKLGASSAVLFFGSRHALTSPNVLKEVTYIKENFDKRLFIPIGFESKSFSEIIENVLDSTDSYEKEGKIAAGKIINYLKDDITRVNIQDDACVDKLYNSIYENKRAKNAILGNTKNEINDIKKSNDDTKTKDDVQNITNDNEKSSDSKKSENIIYTIYGKSYSNNQSDFMFTVFKEVLSKKPSAIKEVISQLTCATEVDFTLPENRNSGKMKPYFRTCKYFTFSDREGVCIGTSYSFNDKLIMVYRLN